MTISKDMLQKKKKRPSTPLKNPWTTSRKLVQAISIIICVLLFVASQRNGWAASLVVMPFRLDLLVMLSNLLASHTFLAASSLALLLLFFTLVFGRAWCGWICPLGTTLDLFPLNHWRNKKSPPAEGWRVVKYTLLLVILLSALLGNLTLLFLDPITIWFRTLTVSVWPALDQIVTSGESLLYPVPFLSGIISAFDGVIRPFILPSSPAFYKDTWIYAGIFIFLISLNLFAPRFWCRYLCPLGGLLGLISKLAIFKRQVNKDCISCARCAGVCPTGTIDANRNYASDPAECTLCMNCIAACSQKANAIKPGLSWGGWQPYDPGRREVLVSLGVALAGVALAGSDQLARRESPFLLRPPGSRENNADPVTLTKCIRCGECMRTCPTHAIQPSVFESGLEGLGTPVFNMRLGFCDYSCNACGQICPVQAIPALTLSQKRMQVIGKAYIDQSRCIEWSDHQPCVVCLEMCPLPVKAIQIEQAQVWSPDGNNVTLQLPHVVRERCIGCGICEYQCPVSGTAAIRVYAPQSSSQF